MLVYGVGAHLADMLEWHPELASQVERVFDKDSKKIGELCPGLNIKIESPQELKKLPPGSELVVAAIRYIEEIVVDIKSINSRLICKNIDDVCATVFNNELKKYSIKELLNYSGPDFVDRCYESILERCADVLGKKQYVNRLVKGYSDRKDIIKEMAFSAEAKSKGFKLRDDELSCLYKQGNISEGMDVNLRYIQDKISDLMLAHNLLAEKILSGKDKEEILVPKLPVNARRIYEKLMGD